MSLQIGGILGAAAQLTTAFGEEYGVKKFLKTIDKFGVQVKNNFEVNFSGLQDVTFVIQNIDIPGVRQNFTEVHYDGRKVDIPINHEFDHEFSMTVLNDAQGYIYAAITNFIVTDASNHLANSGYTMTIKGLTGDKKYSGSLITCRGVRFESVSGLSFGQSDNDIQTFTINGKIIDFTYTPGGLGKAAGILGAINSIVG